MQPYTLKHSSGAGAVGVLRARFGQGPGLDNLQCCGNETSRRFEGVEPLGNSVQVPYTSCYHCEDEVREGSVQSNHSELTSKTSTHLAFSALKWFEGVEPLGNSVQVPYTPCYHCEDEVREGSVQSNHSELTSKTSTHLTTFQHLCLSKHRCQLVHWYTISLS